LKHCNAFIILQSYISKWSKLSIPACDKTFIPTLCITAFSWEYRRHKFLILVVRCTQIFHPLPFWPCRVDMINRGADWKSGFNQIFLTCTYISS
jgi:hypothetical protein